MIQQNLDVWMKEIKGWLCFDSLEGRDNMSQGRNSLQSVT